MATFLRQIGDFLGWHNRYILFTSRLWALGGGNKTIKKEEAVG